MFKAIWKLGIIDFDLIKSIRKTALVDTDGIPENIAFDERDPIAAHLLVTTEEGDPIATARIYPAENITRMGHIAVLPEYRGMNYDELCLRMMLYKAQKLSPELIEAFLTEHERPLYESFGFKLKSENPDSPYAVYQLLKRDIDLSGSCKHK